MSSKYILDTNFILRYFLKDNEKQFIKAEEMFLEVMSGRKIAILHESVFIEVIYVLKSFYEVPKEKIIDILEGLLLYKGISCDKELFIKSLEIYKNNNIHIVDAIIKANSYINSLEILSFDQKLQNLKSAENERK
jgi:predicted nucleic-acid-binding protein